MAMFLGQSDYIFLQLLLHGFTNFCTELKNNYTAFSQSESSNFSMYMISAMICSNSVKDCFTFAPVCLCLLHFL